VSRFRSQNDVAAHRLETTVATEALATREQAVRWCFGWLKIFGRFDPVKNLHAYLNDQLSLSVIDQAEVEPIRAAREAFGGMDDLE
jgi:hypothetical protein